MKKDKTLMVIFEGHFFKDKSGNIWCNRIFSYNFLERYFQTFKQIKVCARVEKVNYSCKNMLKVSGKNVSFVELPEFNSIWTMIKKYHMIRKIIKNSINDIDCCIMRAPNHLSIMIYDIFNKKKIPYALEFVIAADKLLLGNNLLKKIINKLLDFKSKKMCMKANGVSYVTEYILQNKYPCYHMIKPDDTYHFEGNYSSIDLEKDDYYFDKNKKEPKIFNIIHTGYMDSTRKGQPILIDAIAHLVKNDCKNIKLTLVGDGKLRKSFEEKVKELKIEQYVEFKGIIVEKKKIFQELRNAELFVFPTQSEGLPRSIIEAMANGLPVISTPVDGIPELIDKDYLIDYTDSVKYAKKIKEMIENWDKMKSVSQRNYNKSLQYSKENLMKKRKEFYDKLKELCK